jgi:hypothetical protein
MAGSATGTMTVTVTVPEPNAAPLPKKEPRNIDVKDGKIVVNDSSSQNLKVIENTTMDCCYCTKKFSNGSYIDEERNSYLFDRKTGTFAINNLNKINRYAIKCPGPDWGRPKN